MDNCELLKRKDVVEIKGYEGIYAIQSDGTVWSLSRLHRNKWGDTNSTKKLAKMTGWLDGQGRYLMVTLSKNGKSKKLLIHRLVANSFLENIDNKKEVNHKDGNKKNNNVENLEWCTRTENARHAVEIGLIKSDVGVKILQLTKEGVLVKEHNSIRGAARQMGKGMGNIANCCRGATKSAYGYIWKYSDLNRS